MKKLAALLSVIFILLTFIGAGYVLRCEEGANAGYAVVPAVFALAGIAFYRQTKE